MYKKNTVDLNLQNQVQFNATFDYIVVTAAFLLRIVANSLSNFPLRDATNLNCWLATLVGVPAKEGTGKAGQQGVGLVDHSFAIGNFSLDLGCASCSSPNSDDMLLTIYNPDNVTRIESTIQETADSLLETEFIQNLLDQKVEESARKCPHRPEYNPNFGGLSEFLRSPFKALGFVESTSTGNRLIYFNVASTVITILLFVFGATSRWIVYIRNRRWIRSLSREGTMLLARQRAKCRQMQQIGEDTEDAKDADKRKEGDDDDRSNEGRLNRARIFFFVCYKNTSTF